MSDEFNNSTYISFFASKYCRATWIVSDCHVEVCQTAVLLDQLMLVAFSQLFLIIFNFLSNFHFNRLIILIYSLIPWD